MSLHIPFPRLVLQLIQPSSEKEESEPDQHVGDKRKAEDETVEKVKPAPPKIEPGLLWRQLLLFGVLKAARVLFQSQSRY